MQLASILLLVLELSEAEATNWPQWRGPGGGGVSTEADVPTEWGPQKNLLWKTPVEGRGHSSPVVWGNRIFLTTATEGSLLPGVAPVTHVDGANVFLHPDSTAGDLSHRLKVLAFDADTGRLLWERVAYDGAVYDNRHKKNTYASPTPATDGERVYAYFESQGLYCYDFAGNLLWKTSFGGIASMGMGPGTSPVLFESLVIIQADEDAGKSSFIAALDKKTGREVWRRPRRVQVSWATPLLFQAAGRVALVASGAEQIVAYDPRTGDELWQREGAPSNAIPSPVASGALVVISYGYPQKKVFAIAPDGALRWSYDKGTAYVPSPVLYENRLYLTTDKGILTCLDAETGNVVYEGGRVPVPATFTASLVAFSGKILLTSEDGDTFVVEAGPVHRVVGTNSVGEPVFASPAVGRGRVYIRGQKHLFAFGH